MMMTKWWWPQNEDDLKYGDNLKNGDNLNNGDNLKNEDEKNEGNLKWRTY